MSIFKYSGRVTPGNPFHDRLDLLEGYIIKPVLVTPPNPEWGNVAKYADTISGKHPVRYDPSGNCNGNFMSYKFQPHNNCYAYGTNIATSTFPQPGRAHLASTPWRRKFTAEVVIQNAMLDGLIRLQQRTIPDLIDKSGYVQGEDGHFVALLFSQPEADAENEAPAPRWQGDYHWVRADSVDTGTKKISWSQKDGGDQVTNFDFAGKPISDPGTACWTVNIGPKERDDDTRVVEYAFVTYMWVPSRGVNIL